MTKRSGKSTKTGANASSRAVRVKAVRVKSARGRKPSSTLWLQRQLNDPYVVAARQQGFKSRAAFKLLEMDQKYRIFKPGQRIVDLGAAPGGWTQVAVHGTQADQPDGGTVVGIDILEWGPIPGAQCITLDFLDPSAPALLTEALGGVADVVMSDMAAPTTGHAQTDHLRIVALLEVAWDFAERVLAPGGTFLCKVFQGGTTSDLLCHIKPRFDTIRHVKPPASRKESPEVYLVASGFRGKS